MTVHAVVPVKAFAQAKQRLGAALGAAQRATLARLMLHDVVAALRGARGLAGISLVTADAQAAAWARGCGLGVIDEGAPRGLNAAVARAAAHLQPRGVTALLVLPGDVPGTCSAEIECLLAAHPPGAALTLVPAHDGRGTNALLLSAPQALAPAYGEGSRERHLAGARRAGLATRVLELPGLALDIDQPQDLRRFAERAAPGRAARWLTTPARP